MGMMLHRHMVQINQVETKVPEKVKEPVVKTEIPDGAQEEPKRRGRRSKGE